MGRHSAKSTTVWFNDVSFGEILTITLLAWDCADSVVIIDKFLMLIIIDKEKDGKQVSFHTRVSQFDDWTMVHDDLELGNVSVQIRALELFKQLKARAST